MNSAELPSPLHLLSETSQWDEVRRTYRRVCVLRATGKTEEAATLEHEDLARALAAARIATNNSEQEAAVLTEEADRVSAAIVLAELLAPMLAEHLRSTTLASAVAPVVVAAPVSAEKSPIPAPHPPKNNVPSIADLIDGMLSQQAPLPASPVRR